MRKSFTVSLTEEELEMILEGLWPNNPLFTRLTRLLEDDEE